MSKFTLVSFLSEAAATTAGTPWLAGLHLGALPAGAATATASIGLGEVLLGGGMLAAAASAQQQGVAQKQTADLQAEIYRREADRERAHSEAEASQFSRDQRRTQARQRALLGASGVRVGVGTPLAIEEDLASEIELQRLNILSGGEATASRLRSQASMESFSGRQARRTGTGRAGAYLLQGAGQLFGR